MNEMRLNRLWTVAFGLALSASLTVVGSVLANLRTVTSALPLPVQTGASAAHPTYTATFLNSGPVPLDLLSVLGLILGWTAPVLDLAAWRHERTGRRRLWLAGLPTLMVVPTVLLTLV